MSFVVVILVALLAYVYARSNRLARVKWLRKIDLPGHWQEVLADDDASAAASVTFSGNAEGGNFRSRGLLPLTQGDWRIQGHALMLQGGGSDAEIVLQLHFFQPGQIGLENGEGKRVLLRKQADNVVALRPTSRP